MAQLWVKDIQPVIKDELNKRKKYLSYNFDNDNEYQEWNAKTPWVTVYSNVLKKIPNKDSGFKFVNEKEKTGLKRDTEEDYDKGKFASKNTFRGLLSMVDGGRESFDEIYKNNPDDPYEFRPVPNLEGLSIENLDNYRFMVVVSSCYENKTRHGKF